MVSCFIVININVVIVAAVPVIAVLTRTEALELELEAIGQLRDMGLMMKEARLMAGELADRLQSEMRARIESQLSECKYPPKVYILTACKYSLPFVLGLNYTPHRYESRGCRLCSTLRCTTDALNEVEPRRFLLPTQANLQEHSNPVDSLHTLMLWLFDRFKEIGTIADLNLAITLGNAALKLCLPGSPLRDASLHALSRCLHARFEKLGIIDDLEEGISLAQAALVLRLPGHPERATSLHDVASDLYTRFQKLGEISNLKEAVTFGRGALALRPSGHPDRTASLNSLLTYIVAMFNQDSYRITDIEEAVSITRGDGEICPPKERLDFLCRLSGLLLSRFRRQGRFADLEGASRLHRDILELCPLGHPELASSLHELALYLSERFDQQGVLDDLERAIALTHSALDLRPPGDPDRVASLKSLAAYRQKRITEPRTEVTPAGIKRPIRDAIDDTLGALPPRLLNTETGCLCGRDALVSDFESSKQYQELLSIAYPCGVTNKAHVHETVSRYFRYVTLSHRWGRREPLLGEVKSHSIYAISDSTEEGLVKLQQFCVAARERDYMWAWSDTCCIDKDSSIELQEAIGSMYSWYQRSALTIVHLADVTDAGIWQRVVPTRLDSSGASSIENYTVLHTKLVPLQGLCGVKSQGGWCCTERAGGGKTNLHGIIWLIFIQVWMMHGQGSSGHPNVVPLGQKTWRIRSLEFLVSTCLFCMGSRSKKPSRVSLKKSYHILEIFQF